MEPMEPMRPMKPMEPMKPMAPMKPQEPWWPEGLGTPASTGSQNEMRYAYFAEARRLVVRDGGRTTVYDTGDHRIGGVGQQQRDAAGAAAFTSQLGNVSLAELKVVG